MHSIKEVADAAEMIINGYASDRKLTEAGAAKFFVKKMGKQQ